MGFKRPHSDIDDDEREHGSPGPSSLNGAGLSAKKPKHNTKGKHKAKEGSIEYAKKRVRTIERLFQRNQDLPADVRNDLERELAAHKATVADKSFQKKRSTMISKYHMVRFFERKKASRLAKQLKKKIGETDDPGEVQRLQHELHVAKVDEAYSLYHPHAEPYISLYGKPKSGKEDETPVAKAALEAQRPPMWTIIEKTMEEGPEALRAIRERRSPDESIADGPPKAKPKKAVQPKRQEEQPTNKPAPPNTNGGKAPGLNRRERRKLMHKMAPPANESDDDDGGGFFEEE